MIYVAQPQLGGREADYVSDCLRRGQLSAGPYVEMFERGLADACGAPHAAVCCNGTAAIHLALLALDLRPGDEVLVPALTYVATANAVRYCGGVPVFCDVDPATWMLTPETAITRATERTVGLIVVHLYGCVADLSSLDGLACERGWWMVEDAAEAVGARYHGRPVGGHGHLTTLSFYGNKIITCFPGDTSILVKPGPGRGASRVRAICDIRVGDEVLSCDVATSEKSYRRVVDTQRHQHRGTLTCVTFDNGNSLRLTADHPVYVATKGWVPACELQPGDAAVQYVYRGLRNIERPIAWTDARKVSHAMALRIAHAEGRYRTDEYGRRGPAISASLTGIKKNDAIREACRIRTIERFKDPAARVRISDRMRAWFAIPENKAAFMAASGASASFRADPTYRSRLSAGVRRAMLSDTYWQNYHRGLNVKKNRAEAKLESILSGVLPGEFAFNGDGSAGVRIGNLIPDFVHTGQKKKLIELFGVRWHTDAERVEKERFYAQRGYESLFVWDTELKNEAVVADRVMAYAHNPNVKMVRVVSVTEERFVGDVYNLTVEYNNNYFARGVLVHNCGEGGAVLSPTKDLDARIRLFRGQGVRQAGSYAHEVVGYNYRLGELQAAVGVAQLERLPDYLAARHRVLAAYRGWAGRAGLECQAVDAGTEPSDWMFTFLVPDGVDRDALVHDLETAGVQTRPAFPLITELPMYRDGAHGPVDVARDVSRRGLTLPTYAGLTDQQVLYVCQQTEAALIGKAVAQ